VLQEILPPASAKAVVPVPLHPVRVRERGYDQNQILAQGIAEVLDLPVRSDLIVRVNNTRPQSRLSDKERRINLVKAFRIADHPGAAPQSVLLVDDVIHTGSTLLGCKEGLLAAGVGRVTLLAACG
jgi:ComF family protein